MFYLFLNVEEIWFFLIEDCVCMGMKYMVLIVMWKNIEVFFFDGFKYLCG